MKEFISIAILLLFSGAFISIAATLFKSSAFIKYFKNNHPTEYQRLNWSTEKSKMEGFYENEVLPYIKSQKYLELKDEKLNKIAKNTESKGLELISLFCVLALIVIVILASASKALFA